MRTYLLIMTCFLLLSLPAMAQDGEEWSVWMWNDVTQEFMRVYENGARLIVPIRLPSGYVIEGHFRWNPPAFTTDGRYVAFCAAIGTDSTVFVYDLFDGSQVAYFPFTYAQSCHMAFDETGNRLAVGLGWWPDSRHFYRVNSRIVVIQLASGLVLTEFNPGRRHPDTSEWFPFIGFPVTFEADTIYVDEIPYEGRTNVWEWNLREGTFVQLTNYPRPLSYLHSHLLLASGERIELMLNINLEYEMTYGLGGGPQPNVIDVLGDDGSRTPILYSPTSDILAITFIDNGRKIALLVSPEIEIAGWTHYLDRNGSLYALLPEKQNNRVSEELYGTPDGFVLYSEFGDGASELIHYRFEGDDLIREVVWREDSVDERWQVVWVTPLEGEPGLRPLTDLEMITFTGTE